MNKTKIGEREYESDDEFLEDIMTMDYSDYKSYKRGELYQEYNNEEEKKDNDN